jgi:hypothetical protein
LFLEWLPATVQRGKMLLPPDRDQFKERRKENEKKTRSAVIVLAMVLLSLALVSCAATPPPTSEKAEQQDSIRSMTNKTLSELYNLTALVLGLLVGSAKSSFDSVSCRPPCWWCCSAGWPSSTPPMDC